MPYANPKSEHAKQLARERHARWREKNRDVLRERSEQFRRDNPDYHPQYFVDHREKLYERNKSEEEKAKRRARAAAKREARP